MNKLHVLDGCRRSCRERVGLRRRRSPLRSRRAVQQRGCAALPSLPFSLIHLCPLPSVAVSSPGCVGVVQRPFLRRAIRPGRCWSAVRFLVADEADAPSKFSPARYIAPTVRSERMGERRIGAPGDLGGSMDGTRIRLLGPVDLLRDGVPGDVPGRSLRTLLAVLSLRIDEVVSRDQLVEALWPGRAPATAVNTLQRHLSSLRGLLTSVATISARPPGYVLSPLPITAADATDVRVAERLVAKSRQSLDPVEQAVLLREALALWRGDALGGVVGSAYLSGQVERLARLRSEAQRSLFRARIAQGGGADLVGELEDLLCGAPYDEQLHCQLMLALYRAGRQAEALAVARRLREVLAAELGIDPGSAVRDLETAILRQDAALAGPGAGRARLPAQLPSTIARFTGRPHANAEL